MRLLTIVYSSFLVGSQLSAGTVVLKRAWVEKVKDRATIEGHYVIDHAHKKPNPQAKDGDMHVAGRAPKEFGLPTVAEVMNAAMPMSKEALDLIRGSEGQGKAVAITGAWRLWFEHPATSQVQFDDFPEAANTNPDHSFEIHPITSVGGKGLLNTFQAIPGFAPYPAEKAFPFYESLMLTAQRSSSAYTLTSKKSQYNYATFTMRLIGSPKKLADDGYAVLADVSGASEEAIATKVRMIFVPGTPPCTTLLNNHLGDGDEMEVVGIPRLNLQAVYTFLQAAGTKPVTRKLPYEMIIVAMNKKNKAQHSSQ